MDAENISYTANISYIAEYKQVMKLMFIILFSIMLIYSFPQADKYMEARMDMVKNQISARGVTDSEVLAAMRKVPRHLFVLPGYEADAYGDYPLPINHGQTISQPYIVAYMTEIAKPGKKKKTLEIGTGSGYQAAVLAEIADTVYTIELIKALSDEALARLRKLGYTNVIGKAGDGYIGWAEHAPYDIIIVTAAAPEIPQALVDQLSENGRLVIPVGESNAVQELILVVKKKGKVETKRLAPVRFVPLVKEKK
jgi:protein-L-isoaspartate(D-aspartate) O-methyltransferase